MRYAPVYIPTLNRYEHFYQCLESLEKCIGADKTEVYIGLDYPPLDSDGKMIAKYTDGWRKIDAYLREKEESNGFLKLIVFRRKHNCGVGNPQSNGRLLGNYIRERFDRYIFSEDDNVFSPNFLEYINKGLEIFKDDQTVLAINGYRHPYQFKFGNNNYFRHNVDFSAWGYGIWTDRVNAYYKDICDDEIFRNSFSFNNIKKVKKIGYNRLLAYFYNCLQPTRKNAWITDSVLTCYMAIKDMTVIMPSVSKVRNIGWDNSGMSFERNGITELQKQKGERHRKQIIDESSYFKYEGDPYCFFDENNNIAVNESDGYISKYLFFRKIVYMIPKLMAKRLYWYLLKK